MDDDLAANLLSLIGAFLLLLGIKYRKDDLYYGALNFIGGTFMVVSACFLFNLGFIILNTVWACIGLWLLIKIRITP